MTEESWKEDREHTRRMFANIILDIETVESSFKTLVNTEKTTCKSLIFQLDNILHYWNRRSKESKAQFVEGGKDENEKS